MVINKEGALTSSEHLEEKPQAPDSSSPTLTQLENKTPLPWLKTYNARYPQWLVGRQLLWLTSLFGSLGDALFGFDQGT